MANQVELDALSSRIEGMQMSMDVLQGENRSYQEQQHAMLAQQQFIRDALQSEQQSRSSDDISSITDALSGFREQVLNQIDSKLALAGLTAAGNNPGMVPLSDTSTENTRKLQRIQSAKDRAPDAYKERNGGRGLKFSRYCWHCGLNTTHWTSQCYELTNQLKKQYRPATHDNTMGGSTRFLDRFGKYQSDFGFDSL